MKMDVLSAALLFGVLCLSPQAYSQETNEGPNLSVPKENFTEADANGDGALNNDEFVNFINANADDSFGRASQIRSFGAYNRAFSRVDSDGNGQLTWTEFASAASRQQ